MPRRAAAIARLYADGISARDPAAGARSHSAADSTLPGREANRTCPADVRVFGRSVNAQPCGIIGPGDEVARQGGPLDSC
jgi:hypothetical protein